MFDLLIQRMLTSRQGEGLALAVCRWGFGVVCRDCDTVWRRRTCGLHCARRGGACIWARGRGRLAGAGPGALQMRPRVHHGVPGRSLAC